MRLSTVVESDHESNAQELIIMLESLYDLLGAL
jgi:hypothetical protein